MRLNSLAAALLAGASGACSVINGIIRPDPWTMYGELPTGPPPSLSQAQREFPAFGYAPLTPPALLSHVRTLSSDEFEGRGPGTHGETLTIAYISRAFAALGLLPGVPGVDGLQASYLQDVPLITATVVNQPTLRINGAAYSYGGDFVAWTKRHDEQVTLANAELVFVGYGIVSPLLGWKEIPLARAMDTAKLDFAAVDCSGKGTLEKGEDRRFWIPRILLRSRVTIVREEDRDRALRLIEKAESACLIRNSIRTEVTLEFEVLVEALATPVS